MKDYREIYKQNPDYWQHYQERNRRYNREWKQRQKEKKAKSN